MYLHTKILRQFINELVGVHKVTMAILISFLFVSFECLARASHHVCQRCVLNKLHQANVQRKKKNSSYRKAKYPLLPFPQGSASLWSDKCRNITLCQCPEQEYQKTHTHDIMCDNIKSEL